MITGQTEPALCLSPGVWDRLFQRCVWSQWMQSCSAYFTLSADWAWSAMIMSYRGTIESMLSYCISSWFGNSTAEERLGDKWLVSHCRVCRTSALNAAYAEQMRYKGLYSTKRHLLFWLCRHFHIMSIYALPPTSAFSFNLTYQDST